MMLLASRYPGAPSRPLIQTGPSMKPKPAATVVSFVLQLPCGCEYDADVMISGETENRPPEHLLQEQRKTIDPHTASEVTTLEFEDEFFEVAPSKVGVPHHDHEGDARRRRFAARCRLAWLDDDRTDRGADVVDFLTMIRIVRSDPRDPHRRAA